MSNQFDAIIFGKKTFSSILKDIYDNSSKTEKHITELITTLQPLIKSPGDAVILVPLIKEYLEVKVKNDEHLVKMAAIVQRAVATQEQTGASEIFFKPEELEQLQQEAKLLNNKVEVKLIADENKRELVAHTSNTK